MQHGWEYATAAIFPKKNFNLVYGGVGLQPLDVGSGSSNLVDLARGWVKQKKLYIMITMICHVAT